ncbi:hypothetical protein BC831DRAFT_447699 [Entophlyctis helioformis]|nr:hypothetical protein BC831DRAFT_447699 [Entophlyctis helioformis]
MWKSTATVESDVLKKMASKDGAAGRCSGGGDDAGGDDWDTDPDFVNSVTEKDQRWGKQLTVTDQTVKEQQALSELRAAVVQSHETKIKADWAQSNGKSVKVSYGAAPHK